MARAQDNVHELRDIFEAVSELNGSEREASLTRFTHHDASLRALVVRMLDADATEQPLLDRTLGGSHPPFGGGGLTSGDPIGRYRIVREIGTGGMGSVYLAETTGVPGNCLRSKSCAGIRPRSRAASSANRRS